MNALKTLPARIPLPENAGIYAKAKAALKLYKVGVVNTWRNHSLAKQVLQRYNLPTSQLLCTSVVENGHLLDLQRAHGNDMQPCGQALSREELLTVLRSRQDFRKLPVFAAILAIFFEMTPIVLYVFPRLSPSTCWSPTYIQKLQQAYSSRRERLLQTPTDPSLSIHRLSAESLRGIAALVGGGPAIVYKWLPIGWVRQRLQRHLIEVRADDILLRRGNIEDLDKEELSRAAMARGLPVDISHADLQRWTETFVEPMDAGFFLNVHK